MAHHVKIDAAEPFAVRSDRRRLDIAILPSVADAGIDELNQRQRPSIQIFDCDRRGSRRFDGFRDFVADTASRVGTRSRARADEAASTFVVAVSRLATGAARRTPFGARSGVDVTRLFSLASNSAGSTDFSALFPATTDLGDFSGPCVTLVTQSVTATRATATVPISVAKGGRNGVFEWDSTGVRPCVRPRPLSCRDRAAPFRDAFAASRLHPGELPLGGVPMQVAVQIDVFEINAVRAAASFSEEFVEPCGLRGRQPLLAEGVEDRLQLGETGRRLRSRVGLRRHPALDALE